MERIDHIDQAVFYFLNGHHAPWLDGIMTYLTMGLLWLPLYLFMLYLVIRRYRWGTLWVLLFTALMITASDQLSVVVKDAVLRLRPSQDPSLCCVHLVNGYKGGLYGFYSSHASNTMGIAIFLTIVLGRTYRYSGPVMITWAVVMSYTRIYLGVHYPGDILAGWIAGCSLGIVFGFACRKILAQRERNHSVPNL
jgi:undecaprenyl-diphosphatase